LYNIKIKNMKKNEIYMIIGNNNYHGFEIGALVICRTSRQYLVDGEGSSFICEDDTDDYWWIMPKDAVLIGKL
jgi:hypothetical protein